MANIIYLFKAKFPWDGRLVKICNTLQQAGHNVLVVARWKGESQQFEIWNSLNVFRACFKIPTFLSIPSPNNSLWKYSLKAIFEDYKPDAVIVREFFLVKPVRDSLKSKRIPIIVDMAEHYPAVVREWKKYNRNPILKFLVHNLRIVDKWEKESIANTDYVITVCEEQKIRLQEQYGFEGDRIEIIYNTPVLKLFKNVSRLQRKQPRVFVHSGFHTSEKPINKFVEYFLYFTNPKDGFRLVVAGPGESIPELKRIVAMKKAENVIFLGKYQLEELPKILEQADIGLLPYPPNEFNNFTLHNKIFDYFACGIPVLVSDAKPLKRLVEETNAGISVPLDKNALELFFEHIDEYDWETMSKNAFKYSREKYNWAIDETKLLNFIHRVLND